MNKKLPFLLALSTLCLTAVSHAGEDPSKSSKEVIEKPLADPRFFVSLEAGGEFDIHATKFISNGGGNFGAGGLTLPAKVQSRDFTTMHDPVLNGRLKAGYKVTPAFEVFAGFVYSHADGDSHGAGRVSDPAGVFGPNGGVYELDFKVSEYEAYTGQAGFNLTIPRYVLDLIHAPKSITPFLSATAGGKYVQEQHARVKAGNFVNQDLGLYDDSWVFTANVTLGYNLQLSRSFSVVFESGYGYDSRPERSDDRLGGVVGVNDGGSRLYSTVSLGGKVSF